MTEFADRYWGRLPACIRWEHAEAAAEHIAGSEVPWYAASPEDGTAAAVQELDAAGAAALLRERLAEMRRLKQGPYCNLVFMDDREAPSLLKLFHPRRAGDACRVGGDPIPPWLVISRLPIDTAAFRRGEAPAQEQGLWKRVLRIGS